MATRRTFLKQFATVMGVVGTFGIPDFSPMTPEPILKPETEYVGPPSDFIPKFWAKESLCILQEDMTTGRLIHG